MTTVAKLLARKQRLLELLQQQPGPAEQAQIDRQLVEVNQALDDLEREQARILEDQPIIDRVSS